MKIKIPHRKLYKGHKTFTKTCKHSLQGIHLLRYSTLLIEDLEILPHLFGYP